MALVTWSQSMSVGIPAVDTQHQSLVELVNRVDEATRAGRSPVELAVVVGELVDAMVAHFRTEQALFAEHAYPGARAQRRLHDDLTSRATTLRAGLAAGRKMITPEVLLYLRDWLRSHIESEGRTFGRFVASTRRVAVA